MNMKTQKILSLLLMLLTSFDGAAFFTFGLVGFYGLFTKNKIFY